MNNLILIFTILCLIVAVSILVILKIKKPLKNIFYQPYHKDELIRVNDSKQLKNSLYFTSGNTLNYIKKYILCKSGNDQFVVVNYADKFSHIEFFVISYDKKNNPISVVKCIEQDVSYSSHVIPVNQATKSVNIFISKVDDKLMNTNVIKPISLKTIRLYSLSLALLFLTLNYSVLNVVIYLFGGIYYKYLFASTEYLFLTIAIVVLPIFVYLFNVRGLRKKNLKNRVGGVIEYDFL